MGGQVVVKTTGMEGGFELQCVREEEDEGDQVGTQGLQLSASKEVAIEEVSGRPRDAVRLGPENAVMYRRYNRFRLTRVKLVVSDTRPETLAFCLFQSSTFQVHCGNRMKYMNMFDAQPRLLFFTFERSYKP
ncbi:hypothetical protein CTI12_AA164820 [Artemisia annua]|uniref:Uncharacterized protein n=1 Tax=Artemisia annua TaxID=35608 RepID=A0A2U1PDF9_ARTAN|nr:hypothetical protein CTI12_AA164820 [Artemisia annua]